MLWLAYLAHSWYFQRAWTSTYVTMTFIVLLWYTTSIWCTSLVLVSVLISYLIIPSMRVVFTLHISFYLHMFSRCYSTRHYVGLCCWWYQINYVGHNNRMRSLSCVVNSCCLRCDVNRVIVWCKEWLWLSSCEFIRVLCSLYASVYEFHTTFLYRPICCCMLSSPYREFKQTRTRLRACHSHIRLSHGLSALCDTDKAIINLFICLNIYLFKCLFIFCLLIYLFIYYVVVYSCCIHSYTVFVKLMCYNL